MEQISANTKLDKLALSPSQKKLYQTISSWVAQLGIHMRQEITELDVRAYFHVVKDIEGISCERIAKGFKRCRDELLFLPKPKELLERIPEGVGSFAQIPEGATITREWDEPCSSTAKYHFTEYTLSDGYLGRVCQTIKLRGAQ